MYADPTHYRQYQRMLVDLHARIAAGAGDSADALALRGAMEGPEEHLSEAELARLNVLSGDQSMTHDREVPDPNVVNRVPPADLPRLLALASENEDWEELLALLRADVSPFLGPD